MDPNGQQPDKSAADEDGGLFPTTPIWERGNRRRGFGGRRSEPAKTEPPKAVTVEPVMAEPVMAERRSFAADAPVEDEEDSMILDRPVGAAYAAQAQEPQPADEGMVAPIGRADREPKSHGVGVATGVVAAIAIVGVLGAGGWYLMRGHEGVPELAPGQGATTVATAPLSPTPLPKVDMPPTPAAQQQAQMARAEPAPAPARTERRTTTTARTTARARPAAPATSSAGESGVNASATAALPDAPQPYSSLNPGATPAPVNPAPSTTQATPAPTQGEPIPSTPPTAPQASPPSTDQAPQPATPPQQ